MRFLLIRHAESVGNKLGSDLAAALAASADTGRSEADVMAEAMGKFREGLSKDGDAALSDLGVQQAQALGEYWAPLLSGLHAKGSLHCFVSPFIRTMLTIDPLLERLGAGAKALAVPELMETPGLVNRDEKRQLLERSTELDSSLGDLEGPGFDGLERALTEGNSEVQELIHEHHNKGWIPCGLTPHEIQQKFPRVDISGLNAELTNVEARADTPWYRRGWEDSASRIERAKGLIHWMRGLAQQHQGDLDATAVVVSHGDCLRLFFGEAICGGNDSIRMGPLDNTSVSCLHFERPGSVATWLQFFNRVDHLPNRQLHVGFDPLPMGLGLLDNKKSKL